ncbi:hypothetical protein LTR78_007012 [Recurvomyces mirabilis]|uniref:Uncharacterized protein n=1 Tax=Recurvomyces mirabilis TaxID=574656 RepID=A0AAE0WK54_9PEZI|nr:hypothetical protein LTR78_007012 [Recurvomyces mirabilis]KAK5153396.1 hypothetical protein LTS14_007565 [Recurvomyces mirabilis]
MLRRTPTLLSKHVNPPTTAPIAGNSKPPIQPFHPSHLLRYVYEPRPDPINCTTLFPTREFATDPSHPLHIRTKRKLAAFDPDNFHWRVQCPVDVSKRAFVRSWAAKRVGKVLRGKIGAALGRRQGDGLVLRGGEGGGGLEGARDAAAAAEREGWIGALLVILTKDKISLTASDAEVRQSVEWLLERVREKQGQEGGRQTQKQRAGHAVKVPSSSRGRNIMVSKAGTSAAPTPPRTAKEIVKTEVGLAPSRPRDR